MKNIIKTVGLLSIIAVIPGAMAATSRVSMISKSSPRLPSIAGYIMANNSSSSTVSSGSTVVSGTATTYLADPDCIDNYSSCIKGNDACGSSFEDCTSTVLLHAKMPTCLSILSQCTTSGRTSLFGTSDLNAIATYSTTNSDGEVTEYTYPTTSSVLGQMITAAKIENQLSTEQCVKKYTACVKKENVCGGDFELCTDNKEFKKQALTCDSVFSRCQSAGKTELFGSTDAAAKLQPASGSRLAEMITEGAALAVNNAVATCNKVTDQCILNACQKNPNKCIEGRPEIMIRIADATKGGKAVTTQDLMEITKVTAKRDVASYLRQECQQTIGSNRYCYMTVMGKPVTKESVLTDPDNVSEVFDDMYSGSFGRFAALSDKITQTIDKFDADIQDKCIDTITSCAMRSCGGGIGSVCYSQSRDKATGEVSISKADKSYKEVRSACRAVVDNDANCQYAAVLSQGSLFAGYMSDDSSVFTTLYPQDPKSTPDPIGAVATLNATLAQSYNEVAIENMRKQCQTVALSCVKSMCGKEYENCYRNRTDILAGTYNTDQAKFNNSMNKMGGVLDYNIVIGLCMNNVKNSNVCNEHLKIAISKLTDDTESWGSYNSVRNAWKDANSTSASIVSDPDKVIVACTVSQTTDECPAGIQEDPDDNGQCIGVSDENGCIYDTPVYKNLADYKLDNAGTSLFQELLADVEREAQAKYNAKLTKEQNVCLAQNNGGIMGAAENGSTFMWVKLKSNKIPKNYNMKGLTTKQFTPSNDLYGSFCRARITVTSDDKDIQNILGDKATAYFAVGDPFTCGSWIDDKDLAKISERVGQRKLCDEGYGNWDPKTGECSGMSTKEKLAYSWATIGGALGLGTAGFFGMDALQKNGASLGGLLNGKGLTNTKKLQGECDGALDKARDYVADSNAAADDATKKSLLGQAVERGRYAISVAKKANVEVTGVSFDKNMEATAITANIAKMNEICAQIANVEDKDARMKKNLITGGVMTAVGGALGAGITASVLEAKKAEIKNQAVKEWMEEIGEHIQCYLGTDELGSYGDVISFTIE